MKCKPEILYLPLTVLIASVFLLIISCKKDTKPAEQIDEAYLTAISRMGWNPDGAWKDGNGNIVVEGDMVINAAQLLQLASNDEAVDRQRAFFAENTVDYPKTFIITYKISNWFNNLWKENIRAGFAAWENQTNNVHFQEIIHGNITPQIMVAGPDQGFFLGYGLSKLPVNGNPGDTIWMNSGLVENYCEPELLPNAIRNLTTHEVGHAMSMAHTDSGDGQLLSGTPVADEYSIMRMGSSSFGINELAQLGGPSVHDHTMINYLYPANGSFLDYYSVKVSTNPAHKVFIDVKFYHSLSLCYRINYILKRGTTIVDQGYFYSDGKYNGMFKFSGYYPEGNYTLFLCGQNYKLDYNATCSQYSFPIDFSVVDCCLEDE